MCLILNVMQINFSQYLLILWENIYNILLIQNFYLNKYQPLEVIELLAWKVLTLLLLSYVSGNRYMTGGQSHLSSGDSIKNRHFYKTEKINTASIDLFLWRKPTNKKMAKNVYISNEF